jgi:hypothetical protein
MRRTAVINQTRSLLLERGITLRGGRYHLETALPGIIEDPTAKLSGALRILLTQMKLEFDQLVTLIKQPVSGCDFQHPYLSVACHQICDLCRRREYHRRHLFRGIIVATDDSLTGKRRCSDPDNISQVEKRSNQKGGARRKAATLPKYAGEFRSRKVAESRSSEYSSTSFTRKPLMTR